MATPDTSEGSPSVESLLSALQDKNSWTRVEAARALASLRDPRAVEPLADLLKHLDKNTQIAAAKALGEIGDPRAVEPLSTALGRESYETYDAIKEALTKLGAVDVVNKVAVARAQTKMVEENKDAGRTLLLWGAGLLGIGLVCSFGSYGMASLRASQQASISGFGSASYFVYSGPIIIGGILLTIGFFRQQGAVSIGKILASLGIGFLILTMIFGMLLPKLTSDANNASSSAQFVLILGGMVTAFVLAVRLAARSWRDIAITGAITVILLCLVATIFN